MVIMINRADWNGGFGARLHGTQFMYLKSIRVKLINFPKFIMKYYGFFVGIPKKTFFHFGWFCARQILCCWLEDASKNKWNEGGLKASNYFLSGVAYMTSDRFLSFFGSGNAEFCHLPIIN